MNNEVTQKLLKMYSFIRSQQELILSLDVKIRALEMVLNTKQGFEETHQEALKALAASEVTQAHALLLGLIDFEIQGLGGGKAPDPPLPRA